MFPHKVERFENLMYDGCEPHWHCVYCNQYWPFHCYGRKDLEQMECKVRLQKALELNKLGRPFDLHIEVGR